MSRYELDELRERGLSDEEPEAIEGVRDAFLAGEDLSEDHPLRGLFGAGLATE